MLVLSTPEESCRPLAKHRRRMQVRCQDPLPSNPSETPRDKASIELGTMQLILLQPFCALCLYACGMTIIITPYAQEQRVDQAEA